MERSARVRSIVVFVAAVVLVTDAPVMAQSSNLFKSSEPVVLTMEGEQDQSIVRRRRSGGIAWTGGVLAAAGIVLALRPPVCGIAGPQYPERASPGRYQGALWQGQCTVEWTSSYDGETDYLASPESLVHFEAGHVPVTKRTWNYVGWATAAAGGALMWFGLRGVEVPVRLDVAPTGGFRVSRSLGW